MVNRHRLSGVLFFVSSILVMYCYWFSVRFTLELMALSWTLLAVSRTLIMFPSLNGIKADVKVGKEIQQWKRVEELQTL